MEYSSTSIIRVFLSFVAAMTLLGCEPSRDNLAPKHNNSDQATISKNASPSHPAEDYTVLISGLDKNNKQVNFKLWTNIPGTIELMASINLHEQAPEDVWIGKNSRVRLINGIGQASFDITDLPNGQYEALVTFYPRWGFQDEDSRLSGVSDNLTHSQLISVTGTGESAELVLKRKNNQAWIMSNIYGGSKWNSIDFKNRFGEWIELPVTTRNPNIISNYYFESLDMTLTVNTQKNEVVTYNLGRGGL